MSGWSVQFVWRQLTVAWSVSLCLSMRTHEKHSVKSEDCGPCPFPVFCKSFLIREPWLLSSTWWSRYSLWIWSIIRQSLVLDVNKSYSLTRRKIPFSEAPPCRPKLSTAAALPLTTGTETRAPAACCTPPLRNTSKTSDCFVVCLCFFCFFLWPLMSWFWLLTYVQALGLCVWCSVLPNAACIL